MLQKKKKTPVILNKIFKKKKLKYDNFSILNFLPVKHKQLINLDNHFDIKIPSW